MNYNGNGNGGMMIFWDLEEGDLRGKDEDRMLKEG
jgi:hypothetical protein